MEKGKRILLVLLFVILAAMGIMAGTFLAGGGLNPRPGLDRGERETAQAYPEPSEGQTARAEAGQEIKDSQEMKNGQETKTSIRLETAAEETEMETDADMPEEAGGESGEPCTLLFAGDVYLSEHVLGAYSRAGNITGVLDQGILKETLGADIFMVNQEFPFTDRGTKAADKQFTFRLPPEKVSILTEMGVDLVTLANNHILDFGPEGITDSIKALDGAGICHVGAGENREQAERLEILEVNGKRIGFLGTSRVYMSADWAAGPEHPGVFSTYDPARAVEAIKTARGQCDYLVVYVHWGVERETEPKDYQRAMARQYIDAGADLVIGSHPHVLQPVEYYNGKPIVYSLGNFVFGSSIPSTILFKVVLDGEEIQVTEIPCTSSGGYTRLK